MGQAWPSSSEPSAQESVSRYVLRQPDTIDWRRGTLVHPFCHLVLRAIRVVPPPWINQPGTLSQYLREYRVKENLSQKSLASRLGVTLSAVSRWERGKAMPKRESWAALHSVANWVLEMSQAGSAPLG